MSAEVVPHWPLNISPPAPKQKKNPVTQRGRPGEPAGNLSGAETRGPQSPAQGIRGGRGRASRILGPEGSGESGVPPGGWQEPHCRALPTSAACHRSLCTKHHSMQITKDTSVSPSEDFPCWTLKSESGIKAEEREGDHSSWVFNCRFRC